MVSGRIPDVERRREMAQLRAQGLSLAEIGRRFGVSKQTVFAALRERPVRVVSCGACGSQIESAGALSRDEGKALCLPCLDQRPETPFGQRLRSLRLAKGLTRKQLMCQSGVRQDTIRNCEDGRKRPTHQTVRRLTALLGPSLLTGQPAEVYNCRPWTEEEVRLLGTAPDGEVAARIERTTDAVRVRRTQLGIPTALDRRRRSGPKA